MKKDQPEGIFVVSQVTHHYRSAPSGTIYTFMKNRGLWITDPLDIAFFKRKVQRGSGFRIEKESLNIADKVKAVKKEDVKKKKKEVKKAEVPTEKPETEKSLKDKITEKLTGKKLTPEQAIEVLEALGEDSNSEPEVFACERCGATFDSEKSLNGHMGWHAREDNKTEEGDP